MLRNTEGRTYNQNNFDEFSSSSSLSVKLLCCLSVSLRILKTSVKEIIDRFCFIVQGKTLVSATTPAKCCLDKQWLFSCAFLRRIYAATPVAVGKTCNGRWRNVFVFARVVICDSVTYIFWTLSLLLLKLRKHWFLQSTCEKAP